MPTSSPLGKDIIKEWFSKKDNIKSIIDVGAGRGTYRELLGNKYRWIAIEIWQPYIEEFKLKQLYDEVIIGNISQVELPEADCIIFGDVIEHLTKEVGLKILTNVIKKYRHIVVSIPLEEYKQEEIEGNPYEKHLSTWFLNDLKHLTSWDLISLHEMNPDLPQYKIGVFIK